MKLILYLFKDHWLRIQQSLVSAGNNRMQQYKKIQANKFVLDMWT